MSAGVCDNRTMAGMTVPTAEALGTRIRVAREEAGLTQEALGDSIGMDRTAVVRIEHGDRRLSATEALAVAEAVNQPLDWFFTDPPETVTSRRRSAEPGSSTLKLDRLIETYARDIAYLVDNGILPPARSRERSTSLRNFVDAERVAGRTRHLLGADGGPLYDLQRVFENVDLLLFSDVLDEGSEAAEVQVDGYGIAVINAKAAPGRRRYSAAHELGHHVLGDAYETNMSDSTGGENERLINAFAAYLLLPRGTTTLYWNEHSAQDIWLTAVGLAGRFRASWTAVCNHLLNLSLISHEQRQQLVDSPPVAGDFIAVGEPWAAELNARSVPPHYAQQVVHAYQQHKLTAERAVELLHDTITIDELPEQRALTVADFEADFQ